MATKKKQPARPATLDDLIASGIRFTDEEPTFETVAPAEEGRTFASTAKDVGISALKGVIAVPEAAVGLADIATGGRAGKFLENEGGMVGFRPKEAKAFLDEGLSPEQKAANAKVQAADGLGATFMAAVQNPSVVGQSIVESIPSMLGGGALARAALKVAPAVGGVAAGALGEGALMAGSAAEQIRQQTQDGLLTGQQSSLALATGAAGTFFSVLGGKLAQKLGLADVDTMLAGAARNPAQAKGLTRSVLEGALTEGAFEELPQSVSEQVLQNLALERPLDEGVDQAAVLGLLAGGVMGGGANALNSLAGPTAAPAPVAPPPAGPMGRAAEKAPAPVIVTPPPAPAAPAPDQAAALLAFANERAQQIEEKAKGTKDQKVTGPDGKPATIPGRKPEFLTPEEKAERDFLQANGGDATALAQVYPELVASLPASEPMAASLTGTDPASMLAAPESPLVSNGRAIVADRASETRVNAALTRMERDAGRDMGVLREWDQAPAEAVAEPAAPAARAPLPTMQPGDILNKEELPFKNRLAASNVQKKQGGELVEVFGGWVVRPAAAQQPTQATPDVTPEAAQPAAPVGATAAANAAGLDAVPPAQAQPQGALSDGQAQESAGRPVRAGAAQAAAGEEAALAGGDGAGSSAVVPAAAGAGGVEAAGVAPAKKPPYVSKEEGERLFGVDVKRQAAIDRIAKGTAYFGTPEKARDFITKSGLKDTHEAVTVKPGRIEVRAKAGAITPPNQTANPSQDGVITPPKETAIDRRNRLIAERTEQPAADESKARKSVQVAPNGIKVGDRVRVTSKPITNRDGVAMTLRESERDGTVTEIEVNAGPSYGGVAFKVAGDDATPDGRGTGWAGVDEVALMSAPAAPAEAQAAAPASDAKSSTAPEHLEVGVDDRELDQIVSEFNAAQASMVEGDEKVTHVFDHPTKDEVVRLADKVKVFHKDKGWMTVEKAKALIDEWKAKARAQGDKASENGNAQRIVLSLFDLTGSWSKPWEEAGYQVFRFDIQADPDMGDVNKFSTEFFNDNFGSFEGQDIYAVLAACPCTDFASSGARHFAAKDKDGRTVASVNLVHQTLNVIEYFKPAVWALENPVGRIERLGGLPNWRLSFDPNHLGDPYTKKTLLWGRFNGDLPIAPVDPVDGSKMHRMYGGKSLATKNARSETPEGFSYGFFLANNAVDHPVMAVANKFDRLDRGLIEKAIAAGATEATITEAEEDFYYQDLDDDAANEALADLAAPPPSPTKLEAPADGGPDARAPKVDDLKKHNAKTAADEWNKASAGRRRLLVGRLNADRDTVDVLNKDWADLSLAERKLLTSALNEDFFGPGWYTNTAGARVDKIERPKAPEKTADQLADEKGAEAWGAMKPAQRFDALLAAGVGADADQGQFSKWENLSPMVRQRITAKVEQPAASAVSPLVQAMNDLAEVRQRIADQGRVADDRLLQRERQLKAMVKELEANGQNDELDAEMQGLEDGLTANTRADDKKKVAAAADKAAADKRDQEEYAAAAAAFNPLVPQLRAAREAGNAAEVERLRAIMGPLDLTMRRTQASVNARSLKVGSDARKAKDEQRFADMPVGARVRPSEFPNGNIFWSKQADNQWAGTGGPLEGKTATDAGLAERGGLVNMPAATPSATPLAQGVTPPVSANTIFTEDAAEKARARLKAKLGRLNSGVDPEMLMDGITLAGYHIEKGARTFAAFARAMVDDLGEGVKPFLKSWYMGVKYDPRASVFDGLDSAAVVEAADVNALTPPAVETQAEPADTGAKDEPNGQTLTGEQDPQALDEVAPTEGGGTEEGGRVRGSRAGRRTGRAPADSGTDGAGVSGARSGGSGSTSVRAPAARGSRKSGAVGAGRAGADGSGVPENQRLIGQSDQPTEAVTAANIQAVNFKITPELRLGQGGEAEKFRDNIAAIKTLKAIEEEGRRATPEEQSVLARYVGWGGLANAFPDPISKEWKTDWKDRGQQLRDLLTDKEHKLASRSTLDSHYTSETVVSAMWDAARRLGFKGGLVAETSMGVGNFLGLAPDDVRGNARFIGVEYDSLTSRIAGLLYPQSTVLNSGLQDVPLADGAFDLNIGNPPFGDQSLRFQFKPEFNRVSIHNQFFLAGVDALKPGGLQINVVSRYLLDAMDKTTREMLATRAKLLGAIRLPDTAFKENARTSVVTDIVILQRLTPSEQATMEFAFEAARSKKGKNYKEEQERAALAAQVPSWVTTGKVADPLGGEAMTVNNYFAENPGMVLGVLERSGKMQFKNDITVRPTGEDLGAQLAKAIERLPADVMNQQQDIIDASLERYKTMGDALRIALSGQEAGSIVKSPDGGLEQVFERETPEGDYELAKRPLTAASPWSDSLFQNEAGKWFTLEQKVDADGKPVKQVKINKITGEEVPTNLNVYDRKVYEQESDIPEGLRLGEAKFKRLEKLVGLRDLMIAQINLETEDAPTAKMEGNRKKLAAAYKDFTDTEGFINRPANAALVANMPDGALVLALELAYRKAITPPMAKKMNEKVRPEQADPAPILSGRVIPKYAPPTSAASPADALAIVLSEVGRVDLERMASLLGKTEDQIVSELFEQADKPMIFKDPETQRWETRNEYLTGNVKKKLHAAQAAGLPRHIAELEAVQPEPWGPESVTVLLGATFVPPQVYADFIEHITGSEARVSFSQLTNSFAINGGRATAAKVDEWGAEGITIVEMIGSLLNSKAIKVTTTDSDGTTRVDADRTALALLKARAIANEFTDWAFADGARRKMLVDLFNEKFNTRVNRQHDGSHLTLPGKVPDAILKMRRHQKNAIWRGISERFMLMDHVVGAGKTFTAIARAMERRRMGLSRKPAIVVPNHMVEQFTSDVYRLYPGAKVLAAGKADFEKRKRRKVFAKIASGDWDVVIIPHSSFGFIGIAEETESRYLEKELEAAVRAIEEAWADSGENEGSYRKPFNVKAAERLRDKITARMDAIKGRDKKDRLLTFEQMGIDDLTVDEAHEFKNLFYSSSLTGVKGMGNAAGSQKAFDLYNKVRVLRETPAGTVTFMTGTPISNSAVEMFTMMRYLAADELKELGLEHFDAWRSQFVSTDAGWEPNETGRLKEVNRLGRSWSNMRSLMDLYYSFTDSVGNEDIKTAYAEDNKGSKFPIPAVKGGDRQSVVIQPTPAQITLLQGVIDGFDSLPGIQDPYERNIERLRLMDRARKLSLDVRAADKGNTSDEKGGKLEIIAQRAVEIYKKWDSDKGTQLIFLDRSVPKAKGDDKIVKAYDAAVADRNKAMDADDEAGLRRALERLDKFDANEVEELRAALAGGWNAYQQIKDNLIALGVPASEIRFIQEATNDAQKQAIFDAVNAGEIRFLIGSTPRMGAGTNVQKRLVALHHADVTWKPSDIEQREGRIIRQGNLLLDKYGIDKFEVEILAYATERTIDAKMWNLNSAKLKTINAIRNYDGSFTMDFEDEDSASMAELAALASGNPLLMERVKLDSDINKLELLERQHRRKTFGFRSRIEDAERALKNGPRDAAEAEERATEAQAGMEELEEHKAGRSVVVEGQTFDGFNEAFKAINASIEAQQAGDDKAKFSVKVGERRLTSKDGAYDAVADALGDQIPFLAKVDGVEYVGRTQLARQLAKQVGTVAVDLSAGEEKTVVKGNLLGFALEVAAARTPGGSHYAELALVDSKGRTVSTAQFRGAIDSASYSTQTLQRALDELTGRMNPDAFRERAKDARQRAERAERELPELREKVNAPFAQADELKQKRERLEEVIRALASDTSAPGPVDQPAANASTDEANPGPAMFSSIRSAKSAQPKLSQDAVEQAVSAALNRVVGAPRVQVAVSTAAAGITPPAGVVPKGVTLPDGSVFVFADGAESVVDVYKTVFHELFHRGSKVRFTSNADYITKMLDIAANDAAVQGEATAWKNTEDGRAKRAEFESRGPMTGARLANFEALAVEEALASMGEKVASGELHNPETTVKQILRFLSKVANAWGMNRLTLWLNSRSMAEAEQFILETISMSGGKVNQFTNAVLFRSADAPNDPRAMVAQAREVVTDLFNTPGKLNWWHKSVGTQYNLAQRSPAFKRVFDRVQDFLNDVSYHATEAAQLAPKILPKLDTWRDIFRTPLSPEDNKAIAAPIFEGTLAWRRDESGAPVKMTDVEAAAGDLTVEQKAQRLLRGDHITERTLRMWRGLPLEQFESIIESKFERDMLAAGIVWKDSELADLFSLTPEQIDLYREFRAATDKSLSTLAISDMLRFGGADTAALRDEAMQAEDANVAAVLLREMADRDDDRREVLIDTANKMIEKADKVQGLMDRGYAPLSRFGQYSLDVVDEAGERVYFGLFESKAEANKMARAMRANFEGATIRQGTMSQEAYKLFAGVSPETLELFGTMLGLEADGTGAKDKAFQEYLKLAKGNRSAMKRLIQRKGVAGFSEDAGRVLAGFIYSNARQTASSLHMGEMAEAANDIPNQQGELKDAALKLIDYIKNPVEEASKLRGLLFAQYLGGSIASAMVNMLQPVQVTLPYLTQFGGVRAASVQMKNALVDVLKKSTGDAELDAALKQAEEEGIVAPQEVHQLMAQAQGSGTLRPGDGTALGNARAKAGNAVAKASLAWGKAFGAAEQFNRRLTFIASYRLAKEQGIPSPAKFAEKTIAETQFVYNKGSRPRWARGAVGGTLFTFKQYSIAYMELLARMAASGPEGKRAALMAVGVLFLMAGSGGLPFVEDIEDVVDGLMTRLGYNFSLKQKRKELLADAFGEEAGRFMEQGISGLPGSPIDVSGRLGLGNLIPGTGLFLKKDDFSRDIVDAVGPAGDLVRRGFQSANALAGGEVGKAAELLFPVAARNLTKAVDMANTGMYRDDRGRKVLDVDGYDALAKAIGFQPGDVAKVQEATFATQRMISVNKLTESEIAGKWALGLFEGDQDKVADARERMLQWNRDNPESPIRINMGQILKRVRAMRMGKEERIAMTAPSEIRATVRRELASEVP